jgi:DNA polymerase-1
MLVSKTNLPEVLKKLKSVERLALDTETTGLNPWRGDSLFSIIIGNNDSVYYFNKNVYPNLLEDYVLNKDDLAPLKELFEEYKRDWILHNAKFDMSMLAKEGFYLKGRVICTQAMARVLDNNAPSLSLSKLTAKYCANEEKSDEVMAYIKQNKLYRSETVGSKTQKRPLFAHVPLEIMQRYAEQDVKSTYSLATAIDNQLVKLRERVFSKKKVDISPLITNEIELTKTLYFIQRAGIRVDREYCIEAIKYEKKLAKEAEERYCELTGRLSLKDSGKELGEVLTEAGVELPKTEKGNNKTDAATLETIDHPIIEQVLAYRSSLKKSGTYFKNFLDLMGVRTGKIHANLNQAGTVTGRFSSSAPNSQNFPKRADSEGKYKIRRCFIPSERYCFLLIDYEQMEYRLMLNYAKEYSVIEKIRAGMDVHQATAQQVGVSRTQAKTLNFAILYGAGISRIAEMLDVSDEEATKLRREFFKALPHVKKLIDRVQGSAKKDQILVNWAGRPLHFKDTSKTYASCNHLIQGGCADIVKIAMNQCAKYLMGKKSRMVMNIHDELIFEVHESELNICEDLASIMANAYNKKSHLTMDVSISHSWDNLFDIKEGVPHGRKTGDTL